MKAKIKVISSNNYDLFQERLDQFISSLGNDDVIVDIEFSTAALESTIEFSALIHYQQTEPW